MAWTIPDEGEGAASRQSVLFQEYLDVLVAGLSGIDAVIHGCAVTPSSGMTLSVAKGSVLSNRALFNVTAGTVSIGTADATNPRIDLVVVTSSGAKAVRAGTPGANPKPPARSANDVVIASVYVAPNDTTIGSTEIDDKRTSPPRPTTIEKTTTNVATNNTTSQIGIFNTLLPNGLMAAGNMIEFAAGGTMLINSGAPLLAFRINYNSVGLLLIQDIPTANDADRVAWCLTGTVTSEADADQKISGTLTISDVASARVAPAVGRVGQFASSNLVIPFACNLGTSDSNSGDMVLGIFFDFSVANVANEVDVEYSFIRLI